MQIALIMLMGLLAKNAILIVEFALDRRKQGMSISWAAVLGAAARLRPILMTSLAMIVGLIPLMLAMGVGAHGNRTLGASAIGGMLIGMISRSLSYPYCLWYSNGYKRNSNRLSGKVWTIQRLNPKLNNTPVNEQKNNEKIIGLCCATFLLSGCHIYKSYDRPESIDATGIYRDRLPPTIHWLLTIQPIWVTCHGRKFSVIRNCRC